MSRPSIRELVLAYLMAIAAFGGTLRAPGKTGTPFPGWAWRERSPSSTGSRSTPVSLIRRGANFAPTTVLSSTDTTILGQSDWLVAARRGCVGASSSRPPDGRAPCSRSRLQGGGDVSRHESSVRAARTLDLWLCRLAGEWTTRISPGQTSAIIFGTPVFRYSTGFYGHVLAGLLLFATFLIWFRGRLRHAVSLGEVFVSCVFLGAMLITEYPGTFGRCARRVHALRPARDRFPDRLAGVRGRCCRRRAGHQSPALLQPGRGKRQHAHHRVSAPCNRQIRGGSLAGAFGHRLA